jgi:cell division septation protein DedD
MSSNQDGIFISRRLVFIMIFVSLCVNVFFLLMGILIGKDDVKWLSGGNPSTPPPVEETVADRPEISVDETDDLDQDLSAFDDKSSRPEPIDERYLATDREPQPKPTQTTPPPSREESSPSPSQSAPPPRASTPTPQPNPQAGGFWVQLSAVSSQSSASAFRNKVTAKGYPAVMVREGKLYKIRVGPYSKRADAVAAGRKLDQAFKLKSWVFEK